MKLRVVLTVLLTGVLAFFSCKEPTAPEEGARTSRITGTVLRSDNLQIVPNVVVRDILGTPIDTTSATGSFLLSYLISSGYSSKVIATRAGFQTDTADFTLRPGVDTSVTLVLLADSQSPPTSSTPGKGASIYLVSVSDEVIAIRGTGGNETSAMLFEVRDSLGIPVLGSNKVPVYFALQGGPNAGEYVLPVYGETDALTGRVSTRITSGISAGVVQVFAYATVDTTQIKSRPVRILIAGGFPVQSGVSLSVEKLNMPAVIDNITNTITASAADKDGNPVVKAAFHFGTNGGRIDAGGLTDASGTFTTVLRTGGLTPPASGIVTVSATTVDINGNAIVKTAPILFSGSTVISAPTGLVILPDSGVYSFSYQVSDAVGNPLSPGTTIRVTVEGDGSGDLLVVGDKDITIPDTQSPTYTSFSATARDSRIGGAAGAFAIKIDVTSQNGNKSSSIPGVLLGSGSSIYIPSNLREPAQIEASAPSRSVIDVAGVGGVETSVLGFTVKDSAGVPFDASKRIFVAYALEFIPNSNVSGGSAPLILPASDSTDNGGRVRVTVTSGTQAGVAQVIATVMNSTGVPIKARSKQIIVRAADPNQSHFSFFTNSYSFATVPGGVGPTFVVQLADTFSNPVSGRSAYFHSWAGNIQAQATSGADGFASVLFLGGNPAPTVAGTAAAGRPTYFGREGVLWVVAQTTGKAGSQVSDSLRVCWSVGPITFTGIPGTTLGVPTSGSSVPVIISVRDGRNNPLPVGTTITASIEFTSSISGILFSTTGDLVAGSAYTIPNAPYVVDPGPGVTDFTFRVVDLSQAGAPVGQKMNIVIAVTAPNIGTKTTSFDAVIQ